MSSSEFSGHESGTALCRTPGCGSQVDVEPDLNDPDFLQGNCGACGKDLEGYRDDLVIY